MSIGAAGPIRQQLVPFDPSDRRPPISPDCLVPLLHRPAIRLVMLDLFAIGIYFSNLEKGLTSRQQ